MPSKTSISWDDVGASRVGVQPQGRAAYCTSMNISHDEIALSNITALQSICVPANTSDVVEGALGHGERDRCERRRVERTPAQRASRPHSAPPASEIAE